MKIAPNKNAKSACLDTTNSMDNVCKNVLKNITFPEVTAFPVLITAPAVPKPYIAANVQLTLTNYSILPLTNSNVFQPVPKAPT